MTKENSFDDFYSYQPRKIDKKKHHARGFNENIHEEREQRVNFKNYIRQIREQEHSESADYEEWVVERGVKFEDEIKWTEVESFLTEKEAKDSAEDYRETDTYGDEYRIRKA